MDGRYSTVGTYLSWVGATRRGQKTIIGPAVERLRMHNRQKRFNQCMSQEWYQSGMEQYSTVMIGQRNLTCTLVGTT